MKLKKLLKKLRNLTTDESLLAKIDEVERVLSPRPLRTPAGVADQVFFSPEVLTRLIYGYGINEIFSNCAMHIYGCDASQPDAKILAYKTHVGGHPFKDVQLEVVESGVAALFEIVSNDCWQCFVSGMISMSVRSGAPMLANNTTLIAGDTFVVSVALIASY